MYSSDLKFDGVQPLQPCVLKYQFGSRLALTVPPAPAFRLCSYTLSLVRRLYRQDLALVTASQTPPVTQGLIQLTYV